MARKLFCIFQTMLAEKKFFINLYRSVGREYFEKKLFINLYRSVGREYFEKKLLEYFYEVSVDLIDEEATGLDISTPNKAVLAEYYRYALMGFALYWLNSGMSEDPEYMVAHIRSLIKHGMAATITEMSEEEAP